MNQETINILLLISPLVVGGIVAAINANGVNDTTEKVESWTRKKQQRTSVSSNWFSKYIINPILWIIVKFSDWTDGFTHRGLKNGVRIAATLYFIAAWLFLLYAVFMIVVIVAVSIAVLYIVFKVLLNSNEDVRRGYEKGKNIFASGSTETPEETDVSDNTEYRIYEGEKTYSEPMATVVGYKVFPGKRTWENPIAAIVEDKVYDWGKSYGALFQGAATYKESLASVVGDKVYDGEKTWESPIATIKGNKVYDGEKTYSSPIATFEGGKMAGVAGAAVWFHFYQK